MPEHHDPDAIRFPWEGTEGQREREKGREFVLDAYLVTSSLSTVFLLRLMATLHVTCHVLSFPLPEKTTSKLKPRSSNLSKFTEFVQSESPVP